MSKSAQRKEAQLAKRFFPIHSLPIEITTRILEHVISPADWSFDRLRTIALVSKSFLSLVISTPTLWAVARYDGYNLVHPMIALENSKDAPLTVFMAGEREYTGGTYDVYPAQEFVDLAFEHVHRWQSVTFCTQHTGAVLHSLSTSNTPLLQTLAICRHDEEGRRCFSLRDAPRLQELSLSGAMIIGSTSVLAGLRDLSISTLASGDDMISSETILAVISSCSMLERLQLKAIDLRQPPRFEGGATFQQAAYHLPHLKTLNLRSLSSAVLLPLCALIQAEQLATAYVECSTIDTSISLLQTLCRSEEGLAHLISAGPLCCNTETVQITGGAGLNRFRCVPKPSAGLTPTSLDLSFMGVSLTTAYGTLSKVLPGTPIDLMITRDLPSSSDTLAGMDLVTRMEIRPDYLGATNTLRQLATPRSCGRDDSYRWLCPNLEHLSISSDAYKNNDELLRFLYDRYGTGDESCTPPGAYTKKDMEGLRTLLAPLKSLTILNSSMGGACSSKVLTEAANIIFPSGNDYTTAMTVGRNGIQIIVGEAQPMSKAEIASWLSSARDFDDDTTNTDADGSTTTAQADTPEQNWDAFIKVAKSVLLSSKTKPRVEFLHEKIQVLATRGDLSLSQIMDLLGILRLTYPRYIDARSRDAVLTVLEAFVKRDERRNGEADGEKLGVTEQILGWLRTETQRICAAVGSTATANHFTLLTWCCALYAAQLEHNAVFPESPHWSVTLTVMAMLLDSILNEESNARPSLRKSALVHTRRAIRDSSTQIPRIFTTLLSVAKSSATPTLYAPLLGVSVSVSIRLKGSKDASSQGHAYVETAKANLLHYYDEILLSNQAAVPDHSFKALDEFITTFVTTADLGATVIPAIEQALSHGKGTSVRAVGLFFKAFSRTVPNDVFKRLQGPILNGAKSANPGLRKEYISLFFIIAEKGEDGAATASLSSEILGLLRAGKTSGPEHRATLYSMLASLKPSTAVSPDIVAASIPLLVKETNETVISAIETAVVTHLTYMVTNGSALSSDASSAISKEMASLKVGVRQALSNITGSAFFPSSDFTENGTPSPGTVSFLKAFSKSIAPGLLTHLKTVAASPLTAIAGPAEGFIAVAVTLKWPELPSFKETLLKSPVMQTIPTSSATKPHFIFSEKVYHKLTTTREEMWLIRAVEGIAMHYRTELEKNETFRMQLGAVYIHIICQSPQIETRKAALQSLESINAQYPQLLHRALRDALNVHLARAAVGTEEDADQVSLRRSRIANMFTALASFSDSTGMAERGELVTELIILAHHRTIHDSFGLSCGISGIVHDGFRTVLSKKKSAIGPAPSKGKDREIEKWETDLRKKLEAKKAAAPVTLSKHDKALIDAQLAKESDIRRQVDGIQSRLHRGLELIRSLVAANVDEFQPHIASLAILLLESVLPRAYAFVDSRAYDTYLDLGKCCSNRLQGFNTWIGVATLRSYEISVVPEELKEEALDGLVIRVLYRLRSLSEQAVFDAATYSYLSPLLTFVIRNGGVGTTEPEAILEQAALALSIASFHSGACSATGYPRQDIARSLIIAAGRYSQISKEASSSLATLAQAIHNNATPSDIECFIHATLAQEAYVRTACLQAMQPFDITDLDWSPELWLACHDDDEHNSQLANQIWDDNGLDVVESYGRDLLPFLSHHHEYVRRSASKAIAASAEALPTTVGPVIAMLRATWKEKAKSLGPKLDEFGIVIDETIGLTDPWEARVALAETFQQLAPVMDPDAVITFITFLINDKALNDRNSSVRRAILAAGVEVVDVKGKEGLPKIISTFESYLKKSSGKGGSDVTKEAVVVMFGRAARHLDATDPRIKVVVNRLVDAMNTPSEAVQSAAADCLPPLVALVSDQGPRLVERLLSDLGKTNKYHERRGAAYALAGVVKGLGLATFQEFDIMGRVRGSLDEKNRFESKQGALFAIEILSKTLRRLFEPYAIELLSVLIASFGDSSPEVRDATQDTCKMIMANMSGYGVKRILPTLLDGLDEKQWRSKKGSIELLGTMAFCAPRQLSTSLPTVIPRLSEVLNDSHAQVRAAANKSLQQFGEVISNPEIREMVPVLMDALVDPDKTPAGLNALLQTTFVHIIDTPSLAIVVPIIEKGLRTRSADVKRKAVQIVGNLAALTDPKDFIPHLDLLLPLVHQVLTDPVPEARAAAAKSLGGLVERLGEPTFPDLITSLLRTLKSENSAVDRQGAAQGLSEVLSGLGMERMEGLLPEIIENAHSSRSFVREGFMSLLVYLPVTFGQRFTPYLSRIIRPILDGLSDLEEMVRTASMKAGRMVINHYSNKAADLLLPELLTAMFSESARIRLSSVTLIGELLFKLSGISGQVELEDDEDRHGADASRRALADVLGKDRRDRVLAAIYLIRQDSIAAATMGELCRKLGDKIIGDIIPMIKGASESQSAQTREGACMAISEVIENANENAQEDYEDQIIAIVRVCLVDDSAEVRAAAAMAFDALQQHYGNKAIDQTIPTLLEALRQPGTGSGAALQALKEIMTVSENGWPVERAADAKMPPQVRASSVFPVLIPTLIIRPITAFNARALSQLVVVAGNALSKRLNQILQAIAHSMETEKDEEVQEAVSEAAQNLLESVADAEGLNTLMLILLEWAKDPVPRRRVSALQLFGIFCQATDLDFELYRVDWIRTLVSLMDDRQADVVATAAMTLEAFTSTIEKEDMEGLVGTLRRTIESTGAPGRHVPGFCIPKAISPMLPIILAGLTSGTPDQREQAALAIGDLVERTDESAIKPHVTPLTGALIRVITQAITLPAGVKTAILLALTTMLDLIPTFVKPFFPQLQRTFCKSVVDGSSLVVRNQAAKALGSLFKSQTRVDPLITELVAAIRSSEDSVGASVATALAHVVTNAREHVSAVSKRALSEIIDEAFSEAHEDSFYSAMGQLFAALASDPDAVKALVESRLVAGRRPHALSSHMLAEATAHSPQVFYTLHCVLPMVRQVLACVSSDTPSISRPAREARETLKTQPPWVDDEAVQAVF
ncbi:translational activator of GCN4 [Tulasnella sp. 331]|nr:translational activator of GCN4 [Tulasnella sp. 331]